MWLNWLNWLNIRARAPSLDHQLIGVRGFNFARDEGEGALASLTMRGVWSPGVNVAQCMYPELVYPPRALHHSVPGENCHCGFNAYYTLGDLQHSWYMYNIAGVVKGWGAARLHPDGWRSEKAEIVALVDDESVEGYMLSMSLYPVHPHRPVSDRTLLKAAGVRYDVPIITAQQAQSALEEFGTTLAGKYKPKPARRPR